MVGLGNPGEEFAGTRHNVGADVVALLSARHGGGRLRPEKGQRALVEEVRIGGCRVALAVPTTYMNESGAAVRPLVRRFGVEDPLHLVVVHDELDLPPGRIRVKVGGGIAGHNGLRSISGPPAQPRVRPGPDRHRQAPREAARRRPRAAPPARQDRELLDACVAEAADAVEADRHRGRGGGDEPLQRFRCRLSSIPT